VHAAVPAAAEGHACWQEPQFCGSVCVFVQVRPHWVGVEPVQLGMHPLAEHTGVGAEQVTPHTPQLPFWERLSVQPFPALAQSS